MTDVPLIERELNDDQCNSRKMMVSSSIDKAQTSKNFQKTKTQLTFSASTTTSFTEEETSDCNSSLSQNTSDTMTSNSESVFEEELDPTPSTSQQTSYFMTPLPNTADVAAQINIGEEQVAKLLMAHNEDIGFKEVITKKKVSDQREKARMKHVEEIVQNSIYGKFIMSDSDKKSAIITSTGNDSNNKM